MTQTYIQQITCLRPINVPQSVNNNQHSSLRLVNDMRSTLITQPYNHFMHDHLNVH